MKIIDVHNHLYPIEWLNYLEQRPGSLKLVRTGPTNMIFYYEGTRLATINVPGHYQEVQVPIAREKQLKRWRRGKKIALIEKLNPRWQDLAENWGREMRFRGQSLGRIP